MNGTKYVPVLALIIGMILAVGAIPYVGTQDADDDTKKVDRTWHLEKWGTLGNLDSAYNTGNTSILGIWVVNHSSVADVQFDTNDSTTNQINASNLVLAYAQKSSFYNEMNHSTAADILIYVRANATNAADGTNFNDSWVMVNFTSADLGVSGGVNLSGLICTNASGSAFIYMVFVFNGTQTGIKTIKGWNTAMCGTGFTLSRNQVVDDIDIDLLCYY